MENNRNIKRKMNYANLISVSLKGISQVILIENPVSGLIILIAITIANYRLGIMALLSALIGTSVGYGAGADKSIVEKGLFGYNSVLIGLSLSSFLTGNTRWVVALAIAGFVAVFAAAMMSFLEKLKLPAFTFPYIILTWLILLASYHLQIFKLAPELVPQNLSNVHLETGGQINIINGLVNGIGQVYFQKQLLAGILILIGILYDSWKLGAYAILGTSIGWLTAYILQPEPSLINLGLYGYNAVLTILALATVPKVDRPFAIATEIIAGIITVPIAASINTLLAPYGLPGLTMPFVLVTWIFIGARNVLPKL